MTRIPTILAWTGCFLALTVAPALAQTAPPPAPPSGPPAASAGAPAPAACLPWNFYPYGTAPSLAFCPLGQLKQYSPAPSPLAPSPSAASGSFGSGWFAP